MPSMHYKNSSSAVLLNSQLGELFKRIRVRRGCLLSPILFNLFPEKIMQETLHDHNTPISISGRPICNLRFADDIDLMGGTNGELQDLTNRLVDKERAYGMEGSTEKSKIRTSSTNSVSAYFSINGHRLEAVFQVHGSKPVKEWHLHAQHK